MSKKPKASESRRARLEQLQQEQQRRERRSKLAFIGGTAAALLALVGVIAWAVLSERRGNELPEVQTVADQARDHVEEAVAETELPPTGGKHSAIVQNCGVYTAPVSNANAIHSLEHGAVWLTYQPSLPEDEVAVLRGFAEGQTHVLVSPYPKQPVPVVATAWGKQLKLTEFDEDKLRRFVREFLQGPQTPEPGAACSGGIGSPAP